MFHLFNQRTSLFIVFGFFACLFSIHASESLPKGFDSKTLVRVLKGEIVTVDKIDSDMEAKQVRYAFFPGVSIQEYLQLSLDHAKYEVLFDEVVSAESLKEEKPSAQQVKIFYRMGVEVDLGIYQIPINPDPEGYHLATLPDSPEKEATLHHVMTNHQKNVETATQNTVITPYKDGILIIEEGHVKVKTNSLKSQMILRELKKFFSKYLPTFKEELGV